MHSGSARVRFERCSVMLASPHLHKVEVWATLCKSGASSATCHPQTLIQTLKLADVNQKKSDSAIAGHISCVKCSQKHISVKYF